MTIKMSSNNMSVQGHFNTQIRGRFGQCLSGADRVTYVGTLEQR